MPSITLSRRRALALAVAAVALVVLAARLFHPAGAGQTALQVEPVAAPAAASSATGTAGGPSASGAAAPGEELVVDVVGAVHRPGLYRLPKGARVADAIARAGGVTRHAEQWAVNLAAPLGDGVQIVVPRRGQAAPGVGASAGAGAGAAGGAAGPVHLNMATVEQLDSLPGVGPVTAEKIVAYREQHGAFTSVDELDAIPGIGPARLDDLRGLVAP